MDDRPTFGRWWQKHGLPYEQAVIRNGGVPWPMDPEKRAATADLLALPVDTPDMELRRALYERRNQQPQEANA